MRITLLALAAGLCTGSAAWGAYREAGRAAVSPARAASATVPIAAAAPAPVAAHAGAPLPPATASEPAVIPLSPAVAAGLDSLQPSRALGALPRGGAARTLPLFLEADTITSQPDLSTVAEGSVSFRRGGVVLRADRVAYENASDLASARGNVRISRAGAVYRGPELQLQVQRFAGHFLQPEFEFTQIGAGGRADRIDFLDSARSRATNASYTSCPREGPVEPDWVLKVDRLEVDLDTSTAVAEGAVLRFLGAPILGLPRLSFPLGDVRKSGWLPPSIATDSRSGVELAVPWYWNIAPNRDATLVPRLITRRGVGLNAEFRYLQPRHGGTVATEWLPRDALYGRARQSLQWSHEGTLGTATRYTAELARVSDDDWWKDFPDAGRSITPRLLPLRAGLERPFTSAAGQGLAYARVLRWQVLQGSDAAVVSPYERSPQIGARWGGAARRWEYAVETEYNRFTLPGDALARDGRSGGERWHLLGHASLPLREPGWWLVPRLTVNAASYSGNDAFVNDSRLIPTLSVDTGIELERSTSAFGRELRQTLEPRLLYVYTPYREQSHLPNYDAAAKDFNFVSIYTDNQFAGIDRVSDAHQLTAGFTTRFVDAASGAEALRLGLVQRYLFRTQRVAPRADGSPDGPPLEQNFSDALLLGSTTLLPAWTLDAAIQYSPDLQRSVRSIVGARYQPGPFRTISATYRLARGLNEQLELGWQWPVWRSRGAVAAPAAGGSPRTAAQGACAGTWYAVGRVNYSLKDSRITDSIVGAEYDAGCWIGRLVAERLSTGRSEATTRLMLQLELVGLSRIGSNPLRVLKDNIPGYRLLREDRSTPTEDPAFFHE